MSTIKQSEVIRLRVNPTIVETLAETLVKLQEPRYRRHFFYQSSINLDEETLRAAKSNSYGVSEADVIRLAVVRLAADVKEFTSHLKTKNHEN